MEGIGMDSLSGHRITLQNLYIGYSKSPAGSRQAIYGPLDLEIGHAEMVGIIGRNGIGKSTLLRTIAGLQEQLSGKVLIDGIDRVKITQNKLAKMVSFVSTESINAGQLRVIELVSLGRFPHTGWLGKLTPGDHAKVQESIERTGLTQMAYKPVHQLSDGERQKVMIARALAQDTPVIVLDEPTAFLDLPSRHEILRLLNNLSGISNKTIIFSTHDLSIAMDEADRICLMTDQGFYEGAPEDLLINQLFRKLFINSPLEFDAKTSTFRYKREFSQTVTLKGENKYLAITRKAMERIGFLTVESEVADIEIYIGNIDEKPQWQLTCNQKKFSFTSILLLTSYLKREFPYNKP